MTTIVDCNSGGYCNNTTGLSADVDLVIIGAGPTGLFSALLARQLGLTVCIFDAKDGPLHVGGADAITARSLQYLEVFANVQRDAREVPSILEDLLSRGIKCNTSTTYADGQITSRQSHWWNNLPHTFYNNFLMIGQPYIERLFGSNLDIPIYYSEPVVDFSHTISPLGVTVKTAARTVRSKYCLAADGSRSFVRNRLGIEWEGTKPNMVWTVLDCWIKTSFPIGKEIVTLQMNGESRMAWIPRERGMQRFYLLLDDESTQENAEASIRAHMAPHTVEITHVEWLSQFEIKERVASTFLYPSPEGPFILAGDAAHVHAVNGGQGMNTGLSDAFNLIWRLYYLVKCPDLSLDFRYSLLSSFDIERRATAKEVIDVASKLVRSTMVEAKHYVELIERNSGFITGMGVTYSNLGSPLVLESENSIFKAGNRCPDLWLEGPRLEDAARLYQKMIYGKYMLLLVGETTSAEFDVWNKEFLSIIHLKPLNSLGISTTTPRKALCGDLEEPMTFGCSWVDYGISFAVLVRPDCYIEYVGDSEKIISHLSCSLPQGVCRDK